MERNIKYGVAYLIPLIGPIVMLFAMKDNDYEDKDQLGQAIILQLTLVLLGIVLGFLAIIPLLGFIFRLSLNLIGFCYVVLIFLYFFKFTFHIPVFYDLGCQLVSKIK